MALVQGPEGKRLDFHWARGVEAWRPQPSLSRLCNVDCGLVDNVSKGCLLILALFLEARLAVAMSMWLRSPLLGGPSGIAHVCTSVHYTLTTAVMAQTGDEQFCYPGLQ